MLRPTHGRFSIPNPALCEICWQMSCPNAHCSGTYPIITYVPKRYGGFRGRARCEIQYDDFCRKTYLSASCQLTDKAWDEIAKRFMPCPSRCSPRWSPCSPSASRMRPRSSPPSSAPARPPRRPVRNARRPGGAATRPDHARIPEPDHRSRED
jgi:hypothetical protein